MSKHAYFKAWSINAVAVKSKVLSLNSQGLKLIFSIKTEILKKQVVARIFCVYFMSKQFWIIILHTLMCLIGVYTRLLFFSKFCTVYTFDRHYTFNKNLNYFLIFTKFYKIVIKNWNNGMENWSGTYFIHFSSKKSLKSSLYTNISLWKIPPYMFIRIVSALYVYNFTRISKTLRLLGSIRQLGTQEYIHLFCFT